MRKKNVVFIMLDSLQFNYLGCYGNKWIKTPNIDAFAKDATVFENNYTEGLPTIPCRRAMMTGRYTLPFSGWGPLDPEDTTIADLCWGRGIHAGLVFDTGPMNLPKYGFTRGFHDVIFKHGHEMDHYFFLNDKLYALDPKDYYEARHIILPDGNPRSIFALAVEEELECYLKQRQHYQGDQDSYVGVLSTAAIDWLKNVDKTKPFLLWLDSFDPHEPWAPPSVWQKTPCPYNPDYKGKDLFLPLLGDVEGLYNEAELHHIRMLYAETVTMVDKYVGKVLNTIRELGIWDDTLIVITSDHGEPMGNGEHGHGIMRKCRPWPYEELSHTPLIVRMPGHGHGQRVKGFTQSCDMAPTIADWLNIGKVDIKHGRATLPVCSTDAFQGKSLLPLIRGEVSKIRDFAISGYFSSSWSIITEEYSFIHWLAEKFDFESKEMIEYMQQTHGAMENLILDSAKTYKTYFGKDNEEELWTCTPGSERIVPDGDCLFDRIKDPFQLNNIIKDKPEVAEELFRTLKRFMADLRSS